MKILQQRDLTAEERLAARLRLAEKRVLQSTLDAVRRCADVPLWKHCHCIRSADSSIYGPHHVHERAWRASDMTIKRTGLGQTFSRTMCQAGPCAEVM